MKKIKILLFILSLMTIFTFASCKKTSFDSSKNITVVTREDGSGTKSAFMEIIGLKGKADVSGAIVATGTPAVLAEVKGNSLAIAFESLGYVTDEVKAIKVDGVEATVENIQKGTYKIARPLNVVYKEASLDNALNKAFMEYLQSSEAEAIINREGYVATFSAPKGYVVKGNLKGQIDISGSTSLHPLMTILASEFEKLESGVSIIVGTGGSGTGYKNAENGVSVFGMISEQFSQAKAPNCTYYEVAKDGIALIVNKNNPIDNLSLEALKSIYDRDATNKATVWNDVMEENE